MAALRAAAAAALCLLGVASAKGGGNQAPPPPPPTARQLDKRLLCDPCTQNWDERTEAVSYAGMDMRQTPHYDGAVEAGLEVDYRNEGVENWFDGSRTARRDTGESTGGVQVCSDVTAAASGTVSGTSSRLTWDVPCLAATSGDQAEGQAEGQAQLTADRPIWCDPTATDQIRTVGCDDRDAYEYANGKDGYLLPCRAALGDAFDAQSDGLSNVAQRPLTSTGAGAYTPIQACCRCGGGTYEPLTPPPPAPLPTTAEEMCLALPGCCYDPNGNLGTGSVDSWRNGVRVAGGGVPLTGTCFSPDWKSALDAVPTERFPEIVMTQRSPGTYTEMDRANIASTYEQEPGATCSSGAWPSRSSDWTNTLDNTAPLPGVDLVICKYNPPQPSFHDRRMTDCLRLQVTTSQTMRIRPGKHTPQSPPELA